MSLVIEALRRVEKTDGRTGSIGAAIASYRPVPKPRGSVIPLLLGLLTGGTLVFLLGGPGRNSVDVSARSGDEANAPQLRRLKGAAGLPPPLIIENAGSAPEVRASRVDGSPAAAASGAGTGEHRTESPARRAPAALVLQAISERDSRPIAIISDQLVGEGDRVGAVRVLRIGSDSVEVMLENGQHDTVRFAPPPPSPEASPTPSPDSRF